jgi:lipopolysaccharide export system permease protein
MKIIYRYIIREFFKPLFFSSAVFGGLVMISEFFRELSFYMENKTPFLVVFEYLLLNLPWWIIQVLPVSVLLAVLFSLGQLARRNEITALKSAGINLWRVVFIFLLCAMLVSVFEITLKEKVIPFTVKEAERIMHEKIKKENYAVESEFNDMVISLPDNSRMTIGNLNAKQSSMKQVVIDRFDSGFNLNSQLVAKSARFDGANWVLDSGVERSFMKSPMQETVFLSKTIKLPFTPKDFILKKLRPEQMTTREFQEYIRQLDTLGIPSEKERIQLYFRWSSAFSHIIVMFIGIPFALGFAGKHGKFISFTFALIFAFVYWGILAVAQSLGENRVISPLLSAWIGNIVFGAAGVLMLAKLKK